MARIPRLILHRYAGKKSMSVGKAFFDTNVLLYMHSAVDLRKLGSTCRSSMLGRRTSEKHCRAKNTIRSHFGMHSF